MAEKFLTYKDKPLVRKGKEIYYGNTADQYIVKFTINSFADDGETPTDVNVKLLKSDNDIAEKDRVVKETNKTSMYDALDVGFVWLERNL